MFGKDTIRRNKSCVKDTKEKYKNNDEMMGNRLNIVTLFIVFIISFLVVKHWIIKMNRYEMALSRISMILL